MKHLENVQAKGRPTEQEPGGALLTWTKAGDDLDIDAPNRPLMVADLFRNGFYWHARVSDPTKRQEEHSRIANKGLDEIEATEKHGYIRLEDSRYKLMREYVKEYLAGVFFVHMGQVLDQLDGLVKAGELVIAAESAKAEKT